MPPSLSRSEFGLKKESLKRILAARRARKQPEDEQESRESSATLKDTDPESPRASLSPEELVKVTDLNDDGLKHYRTLEDSYWRSHNLWSKGEDKISSLKDWVRGSISKAWKAACCRPHTTIADWYKALEESVGADKKEFSLLVIDEYSSMIASRKRISNWEEWISDWQQLMIRATEKEIPQAAPELWFRDLLNVLTIEHEGWIT